MENTTTWYLKINEIDPWAFVGNLFTKEECEKIKEIGDKLPKKEGLIFSDEEYKKDEVIRKGNISWINSSDPECDFIFRKLTDAALAINNKFWQFDLDYIENLQYSSYDNTEDHYNWHMDMAFKSVHYRKLSFSLQLDDPETYEGCDLELDYGGKLIQTKREQGTLIVFPSYALHKVTPLKSGTRKSLVGWICGPKFK